MTTARPARFVARAVESSVGQVVPAGVCPEALRQLAEYRLPDRTVAALTRMVPSRQLGVAELMVRGNNCSGDFARALLAATPASQRADDPRGRQSNCERARQLSGMEKGLVRMQVMAGSLKSAFDDDLYYLALAASFVRSWMGDDVVRTWLQAHYPGNAITLARLVSASEAATVPKRRMKLPYAPPVQAVDRKRS